MTTVGKQKLLASAWLGRKVINIGIASELKGQLFWLIQGLLCRLMAVYEYECLSCCIIYEAASTILKLFRLPC